MTFAEDKDAQEAAIATIVASANTYLADLQAVANNTIVEGTTDLPTSYDYATVPTIEFPQSTAVRGAIVTPTATLPTSPDPSFSTIADVTVPDIDAAAPTLAFPTAPSSTLPTAPGDAPSFLSPDLPTAPTIDLPAVPTFAQLSLPEAPSIALPTFDGVAPTDDLLAPTDEFAFYEAAYSSTLLDPLKAKLLSDLQNGGYGIDTTDEVALFNRARDREVEAMLSRVDDAGRAMAARGFPLPPGELSIHVDRAYQEMQNKVSDVNRDITLQRNKLFVENRQFTIREIKELENILIGFHNSVQERAFNVARATVEMSVAIFDALVRRFNARLELYKANASVFAERIRAGLFQAEVYKTQIEAKGIEAQMQRQLTELYLAQLKGIQISVDMFKTQMEAAGIQAGVERTKIEAFRSQVDSYSAQVQAKVAEFGAYKAHIDGETAKVNAYEAQVRAFNGLVNAAKIKSDVQLGKLQSETEQARSLLAIYQAQLDGYKTDLQRQMDIQRLNIDAYRVDSEVARVLNDSYIAKASLQEKALEAATQQNIDISRMTIENARARIMGVVESLRFKTQAAQFGSEKFFALLTALETTVNTLSVSTTSS